METTDSSSAGVPASSSSPAGSSFGGSTSATPASAPSSSVRGSTGSATTTKAAEAGADVGASETTRKQIERLRNEPATVSPGRETQADRARLAEHQAQRERILAERRKNQ